METSKFPTYQNPTRQFLTAQKWKRVISTYKLTYQLEGLSESVDRAQNLQEFTAAMAAAVQKRQRIEAGLSESLQPKHANNKKIDRLRRKARRVPGVARILRQHSKEDKHGRYMGKRIHLECSLTNCYVVVHQFVPGELNPPSTLPLGAIKHITLLKLFLENQ
jgi:hypothetical protein